jgi:twitching motility protein PilT
MAEKKPIPLVGRLAIQLKMLTSNEVERAMAESVSSGNPRLAQVCLQMGLLDREQLAKIQQVQKDLVEKHRARQAGSGGGAETPAFARQEPDRSAVEAAEAIHGAAAHAAETASPMSSRDVDALHATPDSSAQTKSQPDPEPIATQTKPTAAVVEPPPASEMSPSRSPAPASEVSPSSSPAPAAAPAVAAPPAESQVEISLGTKDEVPSLELTVPDSTVEDRQKLESILSVGVAKHASDIHLHAGGALKQRVNGEFVVVDEAIDPMLVERMVSAALSEEQRIVLARKGELDFCFDLPGVGRFRANAYRQQRGLDAVFRTVPDKPPTLEDLGLPDDLKKYTDYHQGMVLITGPAGCGKSATMAALVNHINENRTEHILTVEDPIEIIHPSKQCLVNQRHAGHHTKSFARALRGALREDPDIIVIGELRDLETISLAMTAAETGHFVLATLHTANAVRTVNRMIGAFPSNEQDQVRAMLSESLRAVLSQRLVPTADGQSRVPALELLVINRAIGNLIRDEKTVQIRSSMQTGKAHGMYLLEQSLNELVAAGKITRDVALELAEEEKLITAGA